MISYEELIAPLMAAWSRLKSGKPAAYDGPEPKIDRAVSPPISDALSMDGLSYHAERGRNVEDVVIHAAFRLGMDQGVEYILSHNRELIDQALREIERGDLTWAVPYLRRLLQGAR